VIVAVIVVGLFNLVLGFACAVVSDQDWFRGLFGLPDADAAVLSVVDDAETDASPPPMLMTNDWKKILARLNVATEDPAEASWWVALDLVEKQRRTVTGFLAGGREEQVENAPKQVAAWDLARSEGALTFQRVVDTIHRAELAEVPHTDHLAEVLTEFVLNSSEATDDSDSEQEENSKDESVDTESTQPAYPGAGDARPGHDAGTLIGRMHDELDSLHEMRDDMLEWLSRDAIEKSKFDNIPGKLRIDHATKLYNRAGLEYVVRQFFADTEGQETATLMVCNVDQCRVLNEQHGVYVTDHVLIEVARELDKSIRKERGFDRVARLGGQTLAMFLGYTDLDGAERFADRWRLRIETTEFRMQEMVVQLTISTAILNFDFHRTLAENLETALAGIEAARADGGNTGKRVEEETTTIVTDEPAPEKREIALEDLEDSSLGSLIPLE